MKTATATPHRRPIGRRLSFPPAPNLLAPHRGEEPKPIGQLMQPVREIIRHPDRNRLMVELFRRYI